MHQKHKKAPKAQKSTKSTKKHQKHKKALKARKRKQAKVENTTSEQQWKMRLITSKRKIVTYSLIWVFVRVKKRTLEKTEKSHNGNVLNTDVPTTWLMY